MFCSRVWSPQSELPCFRGHNGSNCQQIEDTASLVKNAKINIMTKSAMTKTASMTTVTSVIQIPVNMAPDVNFIKKKCVFIPM